MVEAAGYAGLLTAANWLYWLVAALVLWWAWRKPAARQNKIVAVTLVAVLFLALPAIRIYHFASYKWKYNQAKALFDERCKTAGEKIYKTVEGVDGVLLANVRPAKISDSSQYDFDDQYGYNVGGDEYIRYYLIGGGDLKSRYRFVEASRASKKYRFSTPLDAATSREYWTKGGGEVTVHSTPVDEFSARYSIEWKDISTKEDRDSWIAGGALRITDLKTGEVLGERVGYLLETGMGSTAGQRSPWSWARYYAKSCPTVNEHNRIFVEKVLKPIKGE